MSIHDFHSKLTSGKEEDGFIEALRRLKAKGSLTIWKSEAGGEPAPGWPMWDQQESGLPA